jgi:hypothetical protein
VRSSRLFSLVLGCIGVSAFAQSLPPLFSNPLASDLHIGMTQREVESLAHVGFKEGRTKRVVAIGLESGRHPISVTVSKKTMKVVEVSASMSKPYSIDEVIPLVDGFTNAKAIQSGSLLHHVGVFASDKRDGWVLCTNVDHVFTYQTWTTRGGSTEAAIALVDLRWLDSELSRLRKMQSRLGTRIGEDVPALCR